MESSVDPGPSHAPAESGNGLAVSGLARGRAVCGWCPVEISPSPACSGSLSVLRRARCPHSAIPCFCPVCAGLLTALLALRPFQANHSARCAAVVLVLAPACARLRPVDDRLLLLRLANTRSMKALLLPVVK